MRLSLEQTRRELLRRQGLMQSLPSKFDAMHAMIAVQTQYAASLNVALAARSSQPEPLFEVEGLVPDGYLVKSWSLRNTVHTHTREDHRLVISAVGLPRMQKYRSWMVGQGFSSADVDAFEAEILGALEVGPLTRREIHERVPVLKRLTMVGWGADCMGLALSGRVSFVGTGSEQRFAALHGFVPEPDAMQLLAKRYFESFAPASVTDLACWLGVTVREAAPVVQSISEILTTIEVEGYRQPRYAVGPILTDLEVPAARLMAKFDVSTLAHREKSFLVHEDHRRHVFRKAAQVEAVVLLGGDASGTWRLTRRATGIHVTVEPWRKYLKREVRAIEKEAERLTRSLGLTGSDVVVGDSK